LLREVYPREGISVRPEVSHLVEFLETFSGSLPQLHTGRQPALYHDPCYLGRIGGVYEGPRRLLARVADVKEFSRNRAESECSGGGGLVPKTMPTTARDMARRRLREVAASGAARVVTACPTCKKQLARAGQGIEVVDLVTFLARSLDAERQ